VTAPSAWRRDAAGQAARYGFGVFLDKGCGVLAEYWPRATTAASPPFGLATSALTDEGAVPLASLRDVSSKARASTYAYFAAATRRLARSTL
jgi:putative membrane protein